MTERPNSVRCDSSKLFGARYPCLASSEKLRQDIRVLMMEMLKRESYKQKLKACKTKEDVARVKMTTLGNFMSQAKSIEYST